MRWVPIAIAILLVCLPANGQAWYTPNAADRYDRAFQLYQQRQSRLTDRQRDALSEFDGVWCRGPTSEVRSIISRFRSAVHLTRAAARQRLYLRDLGVEAGFGEIPPHLAEARSLCRALRFDFLVRLHEGDLASANDRISTIFRISDHVSQDDLPVSSIVSMAILAYGDSLINDLIDAGVFNAQHAEQLLRSLPANEADPFGLVGSIENTRLLTSQWLMDNYFGEGGLDRLIEECSDIAAIDALSADEALTEEEFENCVLIVNEAMWLGAAALEETEPDERAQLLNEVRDLLAEDQLGLLTHVVPEFESLHGRLERGAELLRDRRQMLQEIADGEVDPRSMANAAILYVRAAQMLDALPTASRDRIMRFAKANEPTPDDELHKDFADAAFVQALEQVRFASGLKRCDFDAARYDHLLIDMFHREMRDLLAVLRADAARLLHVNDVDGAADRMTTSIRMLKHLADDHTVGSALTAHQLFEQSQGLLTRLINHPRCTLQHRQALSQGIRLLAGSDPFGYMAGLNASRNYLHDWLIFNGPHESTPQGGYEESPVDDEAREHLHAVRTFVDQLTPDQLAHLHAIHDRWVMQYRITQRDPQELSAGIEDVIDVPNLIAVHDSAITVFQQLQELKFAGWPEGLPSLPVLRDFEARIQAGRRAVSDALVALRDE